MEVKHPESGETITVFSQEELDQKIQATQKEFEGQIATNKVELEEAVAEKVRLEAELTKNSGDNPNYATLKAALDKKDTEIKELRDLNTKVSDLRSKDIESETLNQFSRGNEELNKKIRHHYENTLKSVKAESKEEIIKKMGDAVKLATDNPVLPDLIGNANYGAASGGYVPPGSGAVEIKPTEKALGSKLGITEDDWKKYGPKLNK